MIDLPQEFKMRMELLLGDEYPSFLQTYEEPRHYGLRVNTLKISPEKFQQLSPFHLNPIPWIENGFFYEKEDAPSRHPFYYAGLYYLQEPSAMTPAQILPVTPGEYVLDLCAAPGGKATALAEKLQGKGLLVANDISASRAKALLKNLEIFGAVNTFVTNTTPAKLALQFPEAFDKILVDAPCSGEGMFRKDIANVKAWSLSKVKDCAKTQKEIIRQAASMLRPGGKMLYSTCTFSPEENEQVIAYLLETCPEMELLPIPMAEGFESGRPNLALDEWQSLTQPVFSKTNLETDLGADQEAGSEAVQEMNLEANQKVSLNRKRKTDLAAELTKCVRIFPHKMSGEGHFMALLGKRDTGRSSSEAFFLKKYNEKEKKFGQEKYAEDQLMAKTKIGAAAKTGIKGKTEKKVGIGTKAGIGTKPESKTNLKAEKKLVENFLRAILMEDEETETLEKGKQPARISVSYEQGIVPDQRWRGIYDKLEIHGHQAYYVPETPNVVGGIPFLRSGLYLGEIKKDRFEPSQAFAMALRPEDCTAVLNLDCTDERVIRYLRGETLEAEEQPEGSSNNHQTAQTCRKDPTDPTSRGPQINAHMQQPDHKNDHTNGWQLVCVNGYPLGWGKLSGGILKNKYHPGWRIQQ